MALLLDTSVLIDHLRNHPGAVAAIDQAAATGTRVCASVLTRLEVLAGMRAGEEEAIGDLFERIDWIEVDADLADRAGDLANRYVRSHPGIGPIDYVIAATAEHIGGDLWTHNVRDFPMFPGLQPPY